MSNQAVLLVEDEPLIRLIVADYLTEQGIEVIEAVDADHALKILERRLDVKLVFTDVNMPGKIDGLELSHQVHKRWPKIELLITSGKGKLEQKTIPNSGEFIPKPYDVGQLAGRVKRLLAR